MNALELSPFTGTLVGVLLLGGLAIISIAVFVIYKKKCKKPSAVRLSEEEELQETTSSTTQM